MGSFPFSYGHFLGFPFFFQVSAPLGLLVLTVPLRFRAQSSATVTPPSVLWDIIRVSLSPHRQVRFFASSFFVFFPFYRFSPRNLLSGRENRLFIHQPSLSRFSLGSFTCSPPPLGPLRLLRVSSRESCRPPLLVVLPFPRRNFSCFA